MPTLSLAATTPSFEKTGNRPIQGEHNLPFEVVVNDHLRLRNGRICLLVSVVDGDVKGGHNGLATVVGNPDRSVQVKSVGACFGSPESQAIAFYIEEPSFPLGELKGQRLAWRCLPNDS